MKQQKYTIGPDCPEDLLPWYVNHTLSSIEHEAVAVHLHTCAFCQQEVATITNVKRAMHTVSLHTPEPRADLLAQIETRIEQTSSPFSRLRSWLSSLPHVCLFTFSICGDYCVAQSRLLRRDLIWMPLLLIPLVFFAVYFPLAWGQSISMAAFLAALFTALGIAFLYGRETEVTQELIQATPTSSHLVLGLRCALVFCYDLLINCALILPFLSWQQIVTPAWFLNSWLAPLCCLSALAFLLSALINSTTAIFICSFLWILRLPESFPLTKPSPWLQAYERFWHQGPLLFGIAALTVLLVVFVLERKDHLA